ncbi:MAG TPA: hypothetical protein ENN75_03025 [candidate division Zixibacteria bacterium]|nr:hypothetical protein [candidate division Zixibacteria bacterium]
MKRIIVAMLIIGIALISFGCCGVVDKAKDMAKEVEETAGAIGRFAEDVEKLKGEDGNFELNQRRIDKFIREFPIFQAVIEAKGDEIDKSKDDFSKGMKSLSSLSNIDKDLRAAGIDNPAEFYLTMIEVSAGMFYLAFETQMAEAKKGMSEQVEIMKKQLDDPNIPEEQKEMLREAIEGLSGDDIDDAELPDDLDKKEIELIRKNFDRLAEVLGMEVTLTEEVEEGETTEPESAEIEEAPADPAKKPAPQTSGKAKGARVE